VLQSLISIFSSVLGIILGAVILIFSANVGIWAMDAWGFFAGCLGFLFSLLIGMVMLYIALGGEEEGAAGKDE